MGNHCVAASLLGGERLRQGARLPVFRDVGEVRHRHHRAICRFRCEMPPTLPRCMHACMHIRLPWSNHRAWFTGAPCTLCRIEHASSARSRPGVARAPNCAPKHGAELLLGLWHGCSNEGRANAAACDESRPDTRATDGHGPAEAAPVRRPEQGVLLTVAPAVQCARTRVCARARGRACVYVLRACVGAGGWAMKACVCTAELTLRLDALNCQRASDSTVQRY
jgi:hypothetical protein